MRYSTAISDGGRAGLDEPLDAAAATAAASATSSGCSLNDGAGPGVTLADQVQLAAGHPAPRAPR